MREDVNRRLGRFGDPLYTIGESARFLDVPARTLYKWAHGYPYRLAGGSEVIGPPVLTTVARSGWPRPVVPFIGLAEGYVLSAIRRSGVPMQRIRPAIERLDAELGLAHALASRRLLPTAPRCSTTTPSPARTRARRKRHANSWSCATTSTCPTRW